MKLKGILLAPFLMLAALVAGVVYMNSLAAFGFYMLGWLLIARFP